MSHDLRLSIQTIVQSKLLPDILPVVIAFVAIYNGPLLSVLVLNLLHPCCSKAHSM
jgi:hypothetical protein